MTNGTKIAGERRILEKEDKGKPISKRTQNKGNPNHNSPTVLELLKAMKTLKGNHQLSV